MRDLGREADVRARYSGVLLRAGWDCGVVDEWMDLLLHASVGLQARVCIAFQGGAGSWSEESLSDVLPDAVPLPCPTVEDAIRAVDEGRATAVWLAARNSTTGDVAATAGARARMRAWLEWMHPVRHALLGPPGVALADVREVRGHPLALRQCEATLSRLVADARLVGTVDGAHAAAQLPAGAVALASPAVARLHGLDVLALDVCDDPANATMFHLLVPWS